MKCKLCGAKTTMEKSVGKNNFIVCNKCVHELGQLMSKAIKGTKDLENFSDFIITGIIIKMGRKMSEKK